MKECVQVVVKLVSQLDPISPTPKYNLRSTTLRPGTVRDISQITKFSVLEVEWITEGVSEWCECVVLDKIGEKFSVFYSAKGSRKGHKGDFIPLVDTIWRFAAQVTF